METNTNHNKGDYEGMRQSVQINWKELLSPLHNDMCKDKQLMLQLYKSLVRPRLECYNQAWRPYLNKNSSGDEIVNVNFFYDISGQPNRLL